MGEKVTILTPEHVELTYELAGIGSRFIAILVDTLLQLSLFAALGLAVWATLFASTSVLRVALLPTWILALGMIIVFAIYWGYYLFFEARNNGQTPGKKVAGIQVIRDTGHPLDFRSALIRNLVRVVDMLPTAYCIGVVTIFFSPQYRRLGDYAAGTLVVKTGSKQAEPPARPGHAGTSPPTLPASARAKLHTISADEYRAVRHLLDRRRELEPQVADSFARRLADPLAKKLGMDPQAIAEPFAFLEALGHHWERRMIH